MASFIFAPTLVAERSNCFAIVVSFLDFENSSWFTGFDEKLYYGKGAFYQASHPKTKYLWMSYFLMRTRSKPELSFKEKFKWLKNGAQGYSEMTAFESFKK